MEFKELKKRALQDSEFKKEWEKQSPFWQIQEQLIQARIESQLTQQQIADKMQVKQSAIARLEKSQKGCNIHTLIAYAKAIGLKKLTIDL